MKSNKEVRDIINEKDTVDDEFERHIPIKGAFLAAAIALIFGCALLFIEFIITKTFDYGKALLMAAICAPVYLIEGIKYRKVAKIVAGIICVICGIGCLYYFLIQVLFYFSLK